MSQAQQERDEKFYERADAHIALANEQIDKEKTHPTLVNDSLIYATARFNAWIVSASFASADEIKNDKENAIEYFTNAYKTVLEEHLDDYIANYDLYMNGIKKED